MAQLAAIGMNLRSQAAYKLMGVSCAAWCRPKPGALQNAGQRWAAACSPQRQQQEQGGAELGQVGGLAVAEQGPQADQPAVAKCPARKAQVHLQPRALPLEPDH